MRYIVVVVMAVIVLTAGWFLCSKRDASLCNSGTVIILNGPSASGKSSIQKILLTSLPGLWLKVGIDNFLIGVLPEQYYGIGTLTSSMLPASDVMVGEGTTDEDGNSVFNLHFGQAGRKVIAGMNHAIAAYARAGNNVIVDYILYDQAWLKELVQALNGIKVVFVGVTIDLATLEEREKSRGTSPVGHARSHFDSVHAHGMYDVEVNTAKQTPAECASAIAQFVESGQKPYAFATLAKNL